ncbi:MAG TPA: cation:proton antiporter, partial [Flavobacteriales bacterium]|nr:cation:proton antiporter [Flavobacteriales bacterium]
SRSLLFYVVTIAACAAFLFLIVQHGNTLRPHVADTTASTLGYWEQFKDTYAHNLTHPLAVLLLQILTIIVCARFLGFICQKLGLPSVIGEIAAGILLGPSFLGYHFPHTAELLFPPDSLGNLQFLSQIGLILFMFVVGMELDVKVLRNRAQHAVVVSHASIIFPFTLGMGLAYFLYPLFCPPNIGFLSFALFLGIAMSITAFPVLARIVQERGLSRTSLGAMAITCAAVDDITAWCLLAAVIAIVKAGSIVSSLWTIGMAAAYVAIMLGLVRPFLKKLGDIFADRESLSKPIVALFFVILILSAYATEVIGIHALFGAFLAGVIMPSNARFRNVFIEKVEDVALVLLLPLFFVYTGLRTEIGLLNNPGLWKWCAAILVVAVAGKFLGSAFSARFMGTSWRESLLLGALMNTRGLMELVVLNIGYDLGVVGPEIFAMMVIMALVTTLMTGPLLTLIDRLSPSRPRAETQAESERQARTFRILVPFGDPQRGRNMVRVAQAFIRRNPQSAITALHLTPSSELNVYNREERERESFKPILKLREPSSSMRLETRFEASNDVDKDVAQIANNGHYDLAIVGVGRSIYEGTLLGRIVGITTRIINPERLLETLTGKEKFLQEAVFDDRVRLLLRDIKVPMGIYVDKELEELNSVVVPLFTLSDSFLLAYAQKLMANNNAQVTLVDTANVFDQSPEMLATIRSMQGTQGGQVTLRRSTDLQGTLADMAQQDLLLIGIDAWTRAVEARSPWLSRIPSALIMRP